MAVGWSCAGVPFDDAALRRRFPVLASIDGERLRDVTPYVLPSRGVVTLFLCRFSTELPILVSIPLDATEPEANALRAALRALEGAGLGVRFREVGARRASIAIELLEDAPVREGEIRVPGGAARPAGGASGIATADCRVDPAAPEPGTVDVIEAELERAVVRLARRKPPDWRGERIELSADEFLAAALHELGHALGFQGHVSAGESIMSREWERVVAQGRRVASGEPLRAATLRALYALPSGAVLRRVSVPPWRTDLVDRMARLAEREALSGPFVRVGDQFGRIFWRSPRGGEYGLQIAKLRKALRDPAELAVFPEVRTRRALPRSRDVWPD